MVQHEGGTAADGSEKVFSFWFDQAESLRWFDYDAVRIRIYNKMHRITIHVARHSCYCRRAKANHSELNVKRTQWRWVEARKKMYALNFNLMQCYRLTLSPLANIAYDDCSGVGERFTAILCRVWQSLTYAPSEIVRLLSSYYQVAGERYDYMSIKTIKNMWKILIKSSNRLLAPMLQPTLFLNPKYDLSKPLADYVHRVQTWFYENPIKINRFNFISSDTSNGSNKQHEIDFHVGVEDQSFLQI